MWCPASATVLVAIVIGSGFQARAVPISWLSSGQDLHVPNGAAGGVQTHQPVILNTRAPPGGRVSPSKSKGQTGHGTGSGSAGIPHIPTEPHAPGTPELPSGPGFPVDSQATKLTTRLAAARQVVLKAFRKAFAQGEAIPSQYESNGTPYEGDESVTICKRASGSSCSDTLLDTMKYWIKVKKSRLESMTPYQDHFIKYGYKSFREPQAKLGSAIARAYAESGMPGHDGNEGYEMSTTFSSPAIFGPPNDPSKGGEPVSITAANLRTGSVVSVAWDPNADGVEKASRAFLSTHIWHSWKGIAGSLYRGLKTQLYLNIKDTDSLNWLASLHERNSEKVDNIPIGTDGKNLGVGAGHVKLTYKDGVEYEMALEIPYVRASVRLVQDRNPQMDTPFIREIHTFPEVTAKRYPTAKEEDLRDARILIVYGPVPDDT